MKLKIKDQVKVIIGKDKGRVGEVEKVYAKADKILVKNINVYKKHVKKSETFPKGGIVEVNRPLFVNKVMFVCPNCKQPTRVGYILDSSKHKQRICRKCQKVIK